MDKRKLQNMFRIMDKLLSENERPYVGIFWYNPSNKKCFIEYNSNKDTPRGRVFYDKEDNMYYIMVGSWINDYQEAKQEILNTFQLNGHPHEFVEDEHWNIGCGYGEY